MEGKLHGVAHSLRFDRAAFPMKRAVRSWLPLNGFPISNITETGEQWIVRVGDEEPSDQCTLISPGVEMVIAASLVGKLRTAASASSIDHNGATGPSNHTPELPDFKAIYAQPEAQKRMQLEAEQSEDRRRER